MPFGLVLVDDDGRVWTVDLERCPETHNMVGLRFSHPTFIEPVEQRFVGDVPECWPKCERGVLRAALRLAVPR